MPGDDTKILGANNPTHHTQPPTKTNQPLVNQLEVLEPSLGLDLIDSQSSSIIKTTFSRQKIIHYNPHVGNNSSEKDPSFTGIDYPRDGYVL